MPCSIALIPHVFAVCAQYRVRHIRCAAFTARITNGLLLSDDDSNNITFPGTPTVPAITTWTLLLYLTSSTNGCVGGETVFYPSSLPSSKKGAKKQHSDEPVSISLETGMALLHKHGRFVPRIAS
jgi:hypothetical protein